MDIILGLLIASVVAGIAGGTLGYILGKRKGMEHGDSRARYDERIDVIQIAEKNMCETCLANAAWRRYAYHDALKKK